MSYELHAVIASAEPMLAFTQEFETAVVVRVRQGFGVMPMSDDLIAAVTHSSDRALGFCCLPVGFDAVLARWSERSPVAYVEAEYFGGVGEQRSAVWEHGVLAFGPVGDDVAGVGPVSRALARIGARRDGDADEFDSVGLGRHRHVQDWTPSSQPSLPGPPRGRSSASPEEHRSAGPDQ